uniref:Uncharacterized protein n=1 Tax=Tanacetum cinerariifolium TaxID=118510 RepID=A0A6L2KT41_TANCI|nr:hypothetical protein [Tanacetum cinerariifolium]
MPPAADMGSLSSTTDVAETDVAANIVKSGGTEEQIGDVMLQLAKYLAKKKGIRAEPSIILPSLPRNATTMTPGDSPVINIEKKIYETSKDKVMVVRKFGGGDDDW